MRILYLDCFSGISGDMMIGALLDAGLSFEALQKELKKLKISGYELKASKVMRGGICGTKFDCITRSHSDRHNHRGLAEIFRIIEKSSLNAHVKKTAKDIFAIIGKAEAKVHGFGSLKDVHLHELGDIDSIVDIAGVAIALDILGIDKIYASVIPLGRTIASTKFGRLPIPGPASLEILKGVPIIMSHLEAELVTPTGAGILKVLVSSFGVMPKTAISNVGYGAGSKEFGDMPNMLRVMIGETGTGRTEGEKISIIETNIDDMNPQFFELLFSKLFDAGALDVYTTNIQMKRSRPAFKLTVLVRHLDLSKISDIIFRETTSIGVRFYDAGRIVLDRKAISVKTKYGAIKVKVSSTRDCVTTISPEYDDCVKAARRSNIPVKLVYDAARSAFKVT